MSKEIRYEEKYRNLKGKFMESVDLAFRLGFEQGQQQAQVDQMAQQQQQAEMQAAQQSQMQGAGGAPGANEQAMEGGTPGNEPVDQPQQPNPMGSELDQHLNELEGLMGKSELTPKELKSLQKSLGAIKGLREMKKSHEAIKGIGLALHKPSFKMSQQANHNLTNTAKQTLQLQKKIVDDVFAAWDEEEKHATKEIGNALSVEGLVNK
jgi:hypothetical protein